MNSRLRRFRYLGILGACVAVTVPLEVVVDSRVWRQPWRLAASLFPIVAGFSLWDVAAISHGHWAFDPRLVTGWRLPGGLPVEEAAFFAVIPTCGLLTWESVQRLSGERLI